MNPVNFLIDFMIDILEVLNSYEFSSIPILMWLFGFIIISMVISTFWRGARG